MDDLEFRPHLEAIRASVAAGFLFRHLPSHRDILAVHGCRVRDGAVDMFITRGPEEAFGARYRLEDHGRANPPLLWQQRGSVADVVTELLALPRHGSPGAPGVGRRPCDDLWLPHTVS